MTRRRRIARLLDRFGAFVFGPCITAWEPLTQRDLDALIEHGASE